MPAASLRLFCCAAAVALLAGCNLPQPQVDLTRHFTLSGPSGPVVADGVRVRPVQLAGHLRSRAMAVRVGPNEVIYLEDVRWAEPLDEAITSALRARLGGVPGDYAVSVQVQRCEVDRSAGNAVVVSATYTLHPGAEGGVDRRGNFTASPRSWDGREPAALVAALRAGIDELADAIVAALPASGK